ncbi:MAG: hypothetical protein LBR23_05555 [Spirochaetaceae bacterium]|nr:hypothetical protein [Spirochaetaceae bacterium]
MNPNDGEGRISWHPAYVGAVHCELLPYEKEITIEAEVPLTSEPLKIDGIIIKKSPGTVIDKNFARIFRRYNIMEFKSPEDYFSVGDFYKSYAYVCLYSSLKGVAIGDMTLTLIAAHTPEKMLSHLSGARGFCVEEEYAGIYRIGGDYIPMQLMVTDRLSGEDNVFLSGLKKGLDKESLSGIIENARERVKDPLALAYLGVVIQANKGLIKEIHDMEREQTLEEIFEELGWAKRWEARGEARGEVRGAARARSEWQSREAALLERIRVLEAGQAGQVRRAPG